MGRKYLLLLCCSLFIVVCTQGCSKLSEQEALESIRNKKGYPKVISLSYQHIKKGTPLANYINSLVEDGCLKKYPPKFGQEKFDITSRCDNSLKKVHYYPGFQHTMQFDSFIQDVSHIKEIITDSKRGVTVVKYFVKYEPTEYFKKLNSIDNLRKYQNRNNPLFKTQKTHEQEITFKKWDDGWRIQ